MYDYRCYSCTTIALQLYDYRGYSRTTIDFSLIEKQVIWQMNCLIALFLSLDCIVINIKNPVISFYRNDKQNHQRGMWVSCSRPSAGLRMHNRCCASAYQLLCKRTTAVVRPTEPTSSITNTIFSDNFIRLFRQLHPYSAIVSYALSFDIIRLCAFLFQVVSVLLPG